MCKVVGKKVVRVDGYEKVTGKAIYGDDIKLPDMLYAAQRYTDYPSAIIKKIDISDALKIQGVKKIILQKDIPGVKRVGHIRPDQYILVDDKAFYSGDVLAVVAATSAETANIAADAIKVEYEPLDGIFNPEEALKKDARLIHPEFKSNIVVHYPLRKGNVKEGFNNSEKVIEREYKTGFHEHAYIEPESMTAVPDPTCKGVKIYGSTQNPFTTRKHVAEVLGLKLNQVNVFSSNLGGVFGGKDDISFTLGCRVGLLAMLIGKPVKITLSRENSIKESYKRHPYIIRHKVGFNLDGKINAMKINIIADSGAYSSMSFFVTWRSVVQATGPYEIPHVETDIRSVYTNNTYTAAFRGFGSPQIIYAQESLMDELADICNISPIEMRKINGVKQGSITASGQVLTKHTVSLDEVIKKAADKTDYLKKREEYKKINKTSKRFKYGIGLACSYRGCCLGAEGVDATSAIVSTQMDGSVYIQTGLNENGQGLRTTFAQITAETLGAKYEDIHFLPPQTATINDGGPTVASRGTLMGGNAIIEASNIVKERIFKVIKSEIEADSIEDTKWENGIISSAKNKTISFKDACEKTYWSGVNLSAYGWHKAPEVSWDEETGQGNAYFTYVYGCQIADIKVDTHTGKIIVENITAAHDVGKAINRLGVEGQIYGGVAQGMGYGVLEHYNIQNGEVKSQNLDEYLIPTIKDINKITPIIVENPDIDGPLGAKSIGEPSLELGAAAVNNALTNATGKFYREIPLTLEKVYLDKQLVKPSRASEVGHSSKNKKQSERINCISETSCPKTLKEALLLLSKNKYKLIAGGTDVVVELRKETAPVNLLYIEKLPELHGIDIYADEIIIGGGAKISDIVKNIELKKFVPILIEACSKIGARQTRNIATIAGNISNAAPCADSVPPLIAYNAEVQLESIRGIRKFKIGDFILGAYKTEIKNDEILTKVIIPKPKQKFKTSYFQLGRRGALNITRISIVLLAAIDKNNIIKDVRIVQGSLFSRPGRISELEKILIGQKASSDTVDLIDIPLAEKIEDEIGGRWSSEYKKPVFMNMCKDAITEIFTCK